jgi:hypothetical protein
MYLRVESWGWPDKVIRKPTVNRELVSCKQGLGHLNLSCDVIVMPGAGSYGGAGEHKIIDA